MFTGQIMAELVRFRIRRFSWDKDGTLLFDFLQLISILYNPFVGATT